MQSGKALKVLVTGGAGFVGGHLMEALAAIGHRPVAFDLRHGSDVCDPREVAAALHGCDAVVHLAAWADLYAAREDPIEAVRVNVLGTTVVGHAAARAGVRMIHGSTACVYGNQAVYPSTEDAVPNPTEIYAQSKLAAEEVLRGLVASHGLRATWARFPGVYGERLRGALAVARFFEAAVEGRALVVHGDGRQTRTPIHVLDLVDGLVRLVEHPDVEGPINLGNGDEVSALELARQIVALVGRGEITHGPQRLPQTWRERLDSTRAERLLGWRARIALDAGLRRTWQWWQVQAASTDQAPPTNHDGLTPDSVARAALAGARP